ncbi:predicted protein [Sclerotinia sclerotiorum 1980 UF-70]|uniref:Uncharacterized protein n=1 Tax=Sclerotinia sclerotiorum (strain ATCC 18683 / 1980 / Ss-1) TaxID=665079 RepID=A7EAA7_SCLS1|nr:predicted protein [Sclerotinia sclerotiorum 1980 UF-70]EDN99385.1 predicted protein [Sclerotinia sclerotiorum 1980 UF-70]
MWIEISIPQIWVYSALSLTSFGGNEDIKVRTLEHTMLSFGVATQCHVIKGVDLKLEQEERARSKFITISECRTLNVEC